MLHSLAYLHLYLVGLSLNLRLGTGRAEWKRDGWKEWGRYIDEFWQLDNRKRNRCVSEYVESGDLCVISTINLITPNLEQITSSRSRDCPRWESRSSL